MSEPEPSSPEEVVEPDSWPQPAQMPVLATFEHPCAYRPGLVARDRAFATRHLSPEKYVELMDAGFRRSGLVVYQPNCQACQSCIPLRVDVARFQQRKSQRRVWRANQDLLVKVNDGPVLSAEKLGLYRRYQFGWHQSPEPVTPEDLYRFLYVSPVRTLEMEYRLPTGGLVAVGLCDVCPDVLSSVYFYFDPDHCHRSLGVFGALWELEMARQQAMRWYYLGYWVQECPKMRYKADYSPGQLLGRDGSWRENNLDRS